MAPHKESSAPLAGGNRAEITDQVGNRIDSEISNSKGRERGEMTSLKSVHCSLPFPTDDEVRWLLDQGIDGDAMAVPWVIRGATVRLDRDTFDFELVGERAFIFRAEDCGEVIDLISWSPRAGRLSSWRGVAFCIGDVDQLLNPASYFDGGAVKVHKSPVEWLLSHRDGICIIRRDLCHVYLANVPRLVFADATYARRVKAWLQPPKPRVELLVEVREERAAA